NFIKLNMATLATTYAERLIKADARYQESSETSRIAAGRKLLKATAEACQAGTSDPLSYLFDGPASASHRWPIDAVSTNPLLELECLGQTLTPVVTNLEAGKFLWDSLSTIRSTFLADISPQRDVVPEKPPVQAMPVKMPPPAPTPLPAQGSDSLQESEARFQRLAEAAFEAIVITDQGRVVDANPQFTALYGYELSEIVDAEAEMFIAPEAREMVMKYIHSGYEGPYEALNLKKDGSTFLARVSAKSIPYQGRTARVTAIEDITNRKQAETALTVIQDRLDATLETIPIIFIEWNLEGNLTRWNRTAAEVFGWSAEEALGQNIINLLVPIDYRDNVSDVIANIQAGISNKNINENITKRGDRILVEWYNELVKAPDGEVIGAASMGVDITEQVSRERKTQSSLLETEQKYQDLLDTLPVGVYRNTSGASGRFLEVNKTFMQMFEADSKAEMLQLNASDLYENPDDRPRFSQRMMQLGALKEEELKLKTLKGKSLWGAVTAIMKTDSQGDVYFDGIIEDITERKAIEATLQKQETQLRAVIDTALDAVVTINDKSEVLAWNQQAEAIFGWSVGEMIGKTLTETIIPLSYREAHEKGMAHFLQTGEGPVLNQRIEIVGLHKDGHEFPIELAISSVDLGDSMVFSAFIRDITETKQAEQIQQENEAQLRLFLEASPDAIVTYDLQGLVTYVNPAFVELFGWSEKELVGHRTNFVPEEAMNETQVALSQLLNTGRVIGFETTRLTKDGQVITVDQNGSTLKDQDGEAIGSIIFTRDISERKRADAVLAETLAKTEDQAKRLDLLNELATLLGQATDEDTVYKIVAQKTKQIIKGERAGITLLTPEGDEFEMYTFDGDRGILPIGRRLPFEGTQIGKTVQENRLINTHSFDTEQYTENMLLKEQGLSSSISVPLGTSQKVIGTVNIASRVEGFFTTEDERLMIQIASLLGTTLENRRLLGQMERRATQLETVASVSTAASTILESERLLQEAVNLMRDNFDFYYVGLFLIDNANEWAVLRAGTGEAGRIQIEQDHRLKVGGDSMIGWSIANRQARIALDVGEDAVRFENPILPDTHSEMALPLISRGEPIGALTVQSAIQDAFAEEDITVLQTMADQLANAFANAQLFEQTQIRARREQTIREITDKMRGATSLEQLIKTASDELGQRLTADYVSINLGIDDSKTNGQ
ncbi:MAG: PAS domain S-box protein, partial [Chloroflexota bacterium]